MRLLLSFLLVFQSAVVGPSNVVGPAKFPLASGGITGATIHSAPGSGCTNGGLSCTIVINVSVGDFIPCYVGSTQTSSNTLSCTDTDGDTFTSVSGPSSNGTSAIGQMFYAIAGHANATETVTPTITNSAQHMCGATMSITPTGATPTLDKAPAAANFSTTTAMTTSATGTLSTASQIAVFGMSVNNVVGQTGGPTPGAGWGNQVYSADGNINNSDCDMAWQYVSANTTLTGTATATQNETGVGHIVTFR